MVMNVLLSNVLKAFPDLCWMIQPSQSSSIIANSTLNLLVPNFSFTVVIKMSKTGPSSCSKKKFELFIVVSSNYEFTDNLFAWYDMKSIHLQDSLSNDVSTIMG